MKNGSSDPTKSFLEVLYDNKENKNLKQYIIEIYKENKRHRYSLITSYIMKEIAPNDEYESRLFLICEKLRNYIDEKLDLDFENEKDENENSLKEDYKNKLEKIYDHISLELARLSYSKSIESSTFSKIGQLESKHKEIENKHKEIQEDISKQRNQYIAILGIFAAIILAFVGGITFSNSVLANMHQVSIYRLTFVASLVALFFGNILFALFDFINNISNVNAQNKNEKNKKWLNAFNIFFAIVIIADFVVYFIVYILRKNEILDKIQHLRFFL